MDLRIIRCMQEEFGKDGVKAHTHGDYGWYCLREE
jgi:hypothetical protein